MKRSLRIKSPKVTYPLAADWLVLACAVVTVTVFGEPAFAVSVDAADMSLRVVNRSASPPQVRINRQGVATLAREAKVATLRGDDLQFENPVDYPDAVLPVASTIHLGWQNLAALSSCIRSRPSA